MQEKPSQSDLSELLEQSTAFEAALLGHFPEHGIALAISNDRHRLAKAAGEYSLEHARVLRAALAMGAGNTAAALLRLQYEALLRGVWFIHSASQIQLDKLTMGFDAQAEQAARNLPGYLEMLTAVTKVAPAPLTSLLNEFSQHSRNALNSFVHVGLHPLHHVQHGFPAELAVQILRFSNGLMHLAYRHLAAQAGSQERMNAVTQAYAGFEACLPVRSV